MLLVGEAYRRLGDGEVEAALALSTEVAEIGRRYGDPDLSALGASGVGEALIERGEVPAGMRSLDEAMVAVTAGEVSAEVSGILYCAVILACQLVFDLPRAREWTSVLDRWCLDQPGLTPYRGQCLVHRAADHAGPGLVARSRGRGAARVPGPSVSTPRPAAPTTSWPSCTGSAASSTRRTAASGRRAAGSRRPSPAWLSCGWPRVGPARRRRGSGRPWPGRPACTGRGCSGRASSILVAAGELREAEQAAAELAAIGRGLDSPLLRAMAAQAEGECAVARGDGAAALAVLRRGVDGVARAGGAVRVGAGARADGPRPSRSRRRRRGGDGAGGGRVGLRPARRGAGRPSGPGAVVARAGADRRTADPTRGRGAPAGRHRHDEPGGRRRAVPQREDRRPAPEQHLRQGRRELPGRGHGVRVPERAGRGGQPEAR